MSEPVGHATLDQLIREEVAPALEGSEGADRLNLRALAELMRDRGQIAYDRERGGFYLDIGVEGFWAAVEEVMPSGPIVYLDMPGVARHLGLSPATIRAYRHEGTLPEPDAITGSMPGWLPETIDTWQANRPGQGAGGGRPRKDAP